MQEQALPSYIDREQIAAQIASALSEDIGSGDHSTLSSVPENAHNKARIVAKEAGIVSGLQVAHWTFQQVDSRLEVESLVPDGSPVEIGQDVMRIAGPARSILTGERLALNFMQRMSGISSTTKQYVDRVAGTGARVLDTRKTTPGIRALQKWAVLLGGGENHRFGLFDMVMLKDNHIDYAGGITQALDATKSYLAEQQLDLRIEIETRNLDEVQQVLDHGGADRIMLDNFTPAITREAVTRIAGQAETESSGGITLDTIRSYAECGVDFVSVGALTHSVRSLDLSLKAL